MPTKISNELPFSVNVVGERTKATYAGEFRAKVVLSYSEEILRNRLEREALGPHPEYAPERIKDLCSILADLDVSLVSTPSFWKSTLAGRQLFGDDNLLAEVYSKLQGLRKEAFGDPEADANRAKIDKVLETADSDSK